MIKAEKLDYKTITTAIENGQFYASRGPKIEELWFDTEDKSIHIKCSDAKKIICSSGCRKIRTAYPYYENLEFLNEAKFEISPDEIYVRITVEDKNGLTADTNAYFLEDFFND